MKATLFEKRHNDRMFEFGEREAKKLSDLGEPLNSIKCKLLKPNLTAFNNGVRSITD